MLRVPCSEADLRVTNESGGQWLEIAGGLWAASLHSQAGSLPGAVTRSGGDANPSGEAWVSPVGVTQK